MPVSLPKIRIIASACITRYDSGEREISDIVSSYNMASEDRDLVLAHVYSRKPELKNSEAAVQ
ncbi:hypothetical protein WMW72_25350 [Paenibacillus filicis]|uniref:DUF4476 domain-containing protein n=1 Tax=Paenibacillus filicis TaxID=669464 RepID=A0ABU9DT33_9BACL